MFLERWRRSPAISRVRLSARKVRGRARLIGEGLEPRQLLAAVVMSDQEQLLLELVNRRGRIRSPRRRGFKST